MNCGDRKLSAIAFGLGLIVAPVGAVSAQCEIQQVYDSAVLHVVGKDEIAQATAVKDIKAKCSNQVKDSTCPVKKIIKLTVKGTTKAQVVAQCKTE